MSLSRDLGIHNLCVSDLYDLRDMVICSDENEISLQVLSDEITRLILDRQVEELMLPIVKQFMEERGL